MGSVWFGEQCPAAPGGWWCLRRAGHSGRHWAPPRRWVTPVYFRG